MRRRVGRMETRQMAATLGKLAVAGALLAAVCLWAQRSVLDGFYHFGLARRCLSLFGTIGVAAAVFFAVCYGSCGWRKCRRRSGLFTRRLRRRA